MRCMDVGQDKLCSSNFASPNGNHVCVCVCVCVCIFLLLVVVVVVFFGYYFCGFVLDCFLSFFT